MASQVAGQPNIPPDAAELLRHPLLGRIGNTPLVELSRIPAATGLRVFAKLESANPGGSVKDRAARAIVTDAVLAGALPGRRLLDASSGNTGISYAMLGAALGFDVTLCLPGSASPERKKTLRAYGVEVIETDALEGTDGAIVRARELVAGTLIATTTPTSTPTAPTPRLTSGRPARRSSARWVGRRPTFLSQASAPAAPSSESPGHCGACAREHAGSPSNPTARCTGSRA